MWARKLGFVNSSRQSIAVWADLNALMTKHPTDYIIFYRQLADVADAAAQEAANRGEKVLRVHTEWFKEFTPNNF